jgi:hypothetical protein
MQWGGLETMMEKWLAQRADEPLFVFSPFITTSYLAHLMRHQQEVHIITSWRKDHLMSGVSDLELYNLVKQRPNWHLYINDRLHAKVYCRNFSTMLMGSANLTKRGLQNTEESNHEVMVKTVCDEGSKQKMMELLQESLVMNDEHFQVYRAWFESVSHDLPVFETGSVIEPTLTNERFLVSQLPASASPRRLWSIMSEGEEADDAWNEFEAAQHDLVNLNLHVRQFSTVDQFMEALKVAMGRKAFFAAFLRRVDSTGVRFGFAKEWVQTTCIDDPVPYRKDLTRTVQHLFAWTVALYPDEFEILRPRHAEILRRIPPQEVNEFCKQTGKRLNASWYIAVNGFPNSGMQYKSCPNCSLFAGELVFRLGRIGSGISGDSSFGFTEKRINGNNPDGIHSWCLECRGTGDPSTHTSRSFKIDELKIAHKGVIVITNKGV